VGDCGGENPRFNLVQIWSPSPEPFTVLSLHLSLGPFFSSPHLQPQNHVPQKVILAFVLPSLLKYPVLGKETGQVLQEIRL
jgi:hypothetical protein